MAKDLSAVGASMSAPKSSTGLSGAEVFDPKQGVRIQRSDNGGVILNVSMKRVQKGSKGQDYPSYCPDKQLTFDSLEPAFEQIETLFGVKQTKAEEKK